MSSKLLVICGPTSTGKTRLALRLAKKFKGEIISADSRQVYKEMDIGTGKGLPKGIRLKVPWFSKFGYYRIDGVKVWGYDLVDPRQEFSVAQYLEFAAKTASGIRKRKKLPIVVGGTGLYIKAVVDGIPTAAVPKNHKLRKTLSQKSAIELFEMLARLDSIRAGGMNISDRKNPRRLIRGIEVAMWSLKHKRTKTREEPKRKPDTLFVGLTASQEVLFRRIDAAVAVRLKVGVEEEVRKLLSRGVTWKNQAMTSLGYGRWREYFSGKSSKEEVVARWKEDEKRYIKRQMTWFKRDKRIVWFDIDGATFPKEVEKTVRKWYISKSSQNS